MLVFITGITGMIGSHFAMAAKSRGWKTYGIARSSASSRLSACEDDSIIRSDMLDKSDLEDIIKQLKPDIIIHMAAQAFNGISWRIENYTHLANGWGTLNLLQACKKFCPEAKILLGGSSAEYGDVKEKDCPIKETQPLRPITPYGVSKVMTETLGYQYYTNYKMKILLPRLFIHVGTGHPPATAIQNFARQLALISKGRLEPAIRVGNLCTSRDFIDVRDGVAGMMLMLDKEIYGEPANICTGKAHKISDVLNMLIEISGLTVDTVKDTSLLRPSDEPLLLGDNTKLKSFGWKQKYNIRETLESVYQDWLNRI